MTRDSSTTKGHEQDGPTRRRSPSAAEAYALLSERFPGLFWLTDRDLRLTHASGALLAEVGMSAERLVGRRLEEVARPERAAEHVARHRATLGGEATTYELDYEDRRLQARLEPLIGEDGTVEGVLGVAVDATERWRRVEAQALLAALVEASGDAIIGRSLDGTILSWNSAAERMYGYHAAEVVGRPMTVIVPPDRRDELADIDARVARGEPVAIETERLRKDGLRIWVAVTMAPIHDEAGRVTSVSMVARDITAQKRAEDALRESEARKGAILESSLDCVVTIDHDCRIVDFNAAAEETFGYRRADALGRDMADMIIPEHLRAAHREGFRRHLATGETAILNRRIETTAMRSDGSTFPVELAVVRADHNGNPFFSAHLRDITDRKRVEAEISHLAFHDTLTGLPNRAMFEQHLQLALARARRDDTAVGVLFLDLDNFKLVNDSLGHAAGDQLLTLVARRLREAARETDLVARAGGDEFLLLLADLPRDHASGADGLEVAGTVAERIHAALERPFRVEETEFFISASIGIGVYPLHAEDPSTLLRSVDAAMYESKWRGPGRSTTFSAAHGAVRSGLNLATQLRRAARDRQWTLHYQPIVDLRSGALEAVEALLRWRHPGGELLLPEVFLGVAEDIGLIDEIGTWVIEEISRQLGAWRTAGLDTTVTMNVSARQLRGSEAIRHIPERLLSAGIDPSSVVIEITEAAAMTDADRSQRLMDDLHAAGLLLAIDDFGTGYTSMSRLKQLPVRILKIDRPFIGGMGHDAGDRAVVTAIIQLARSMGMEPFAEGVETAEQREFLLENGCRIGQGFLFARPLTPDQLLERYGPRDAGQPPAEPGSLAG